MAFNLGWQLAIGSSTTHPPGCRSSPILNGVYNYNTNMDSTATCQGNVNVHCHCGLDGVWNQRGGDIDGEAEFDQSGRALAMSNDGTMLAIGGYGNTGGNSLSFTGHVRIYEWISGAWVQRGADIDGQSANERFGFSVAMSADGAVIASGSYKDNTASGQGSGSVRVFIWDSESENGGEWVQRGATIIGEDTINYFGWEVDLSHDGNTLAISAFYNSGGATHGGHVRIFNWDGGSNDWVQRGADIDGVVEEERSGYGISISSSGDTVVIGAPWNGEGGTNAGQVRIYDWVGESNAWTKRGMSINGEAANDNSGKNVAVSDDGNTLAISGVQNDGAAINAGHVRIFHWDGSAWMQRGADIDGEAASDTSGAGIAMDSVGSTIAIGATANDGNGQNAGHVRIYKWDVETSLWMQKGDDIDGEEAFDASGIKVKLSGDGRIVAIGAYGNDGVDGVASSAGHVRVYELD